MHNHTPRDPRLKVCVDPLAPAYSRLYPLACCRYKAANIVVTLSTGETLAGVVSNDRGEESSLGPVTKFMFVAAARWRDQGRGVRRAADVTVMMRALF